MSRVLIVAHRTAATPLLLEAVKQRAAAGAEAFMLVVPRTYWDLDTEAAADTLDLALPLLDEAAGMHVDGRIGASDPFEAVRDALADGQFDEVIVSTLPAHISKWLHRDLPRRVERLGLPVTVVTAQHAERRVVAGGGAA